VPLEAPDGVTVNWGAARAQMTVSDLALNDYSSIPNGLFRHLRLRHQLERPERGRGPLARDGAGGLDG
jgi:hypothetical protein